MESDMQLLPRTLFGDALESPASLSVKVAKLALRLANRHMTRYSHAKSRHDFTQPQLMACLILRAYRKATYRDLVDQLESSWELRDALGLAKVPNYSTLCKFAGRAGVLDVLDGMLSSLAKEIAALDDSGWVESAVDATGLETTSASAHYQARSGQKRRGFVKLSVVVLLNSLIPGAMALNMGPGNDKTPARELLNKARDSIQPDVVYADAGYDAEWVHEFCNEDWGPYAVINPVRRGKKRPGGLYRSRMTKTHLKQMGYGRRWLVESYMSGLKRTTGWTLAGKSPAARNVETGCKVLAYALRR